MRVYIATLILFIICQACKSQGENKIELKGTKWECKIGKNCINTYLFETDSTFTFSSCEMNDIYFGNYYFEEGFLMIDQRGSIDDDFSTYNMDRKLYKIEIKEDQLKHLSMSEWVNGKWVKSEFKFDERYLYQKTK